MAVLESQMMSPSGTTQPIPTPPLQPPQSTSYPRPQGRHSPSRSDYDWRNWTSVKLLIHDLPRNTTTAIIHRNFKQYGNVSRIVMQEQRGGGHPTTAEVFFKPPPRDNFWRHQYLDIRGSDGDFYHVRVVVPGQRRYYDFKSEVRGITYPEEILLRGSSLGFGILSEGPKMLVKQAVSAKGEAVAGSPDVSVQFILNMKRREILVYFPIHLRSENGPRTRAYRFPISIDDSFSIWKVRNKDKSYSYIIHLRNPPWYSRRLETKLGSSHVPDAKIWSEDDLWARQTDIVHHKSQFSVINGTAISLKKNLNRINVARWTTFKFDIDASQENNEQARMFDEGLQDFNIRVNTIASFQVYEDLSPDAASYWEDVEFTGETTDLFDEGCTLPFDLRYQLEVCISNGRLSEYAIDKVFLRKLKSLSPSKARQMLIHVDSLGEEIQDAMSIFNDIRFQKPVRGRKLPTNCLLSHNATITATSIKINTPTVDVSNRVIRKYLQFADRFLRVSFEDDEYRGKTKIFAGSNVKMALVIDRVRRALTSGIKIAGRHYEFLAYGNSQLREHGAYFFASTNELTASMMRAEMGAFDNEKIVAKRAARMGQCFSTTHPIHYRLPVINKDNLIPDVVINGRNFTDGVGKISGLAATLVQGSLRLPDPLPSCFQFRLGGCKGVLAVDPSLQGIVVQIRSSQFKFESKSQELEIIRCSQFWQPFLNRQIILVLSNLGVRDRIFMDMQKATINALNNAMKEDSAALQALRTNVDPNGTTLSMCELVSNGFRRTQEPFVMSLMELWRAWTLLGLKERARIPVKDGAFVLGVVDETNTLRGHYDQHATQNEAPSDDREQRLPEIFLQINDPLTKTKKVVQGICILARNPSLHPGDIRVVKAVDVRALHHLVDVVVMPLNGDRDLPSMCSGGDLDGDDYMVIWDEKLIPDVWNTEPHHYDPPAPKMAVGEITTKDIIDFYVDYMENDSLGRIAHAHLGNADFFDDGINNDHCLQLVQLHSTSVDYPKTGVPAKLPPRLEPARWPHFMEKKTGNVQHSRKILGQLYDNVQGLVAGFDLRACGSAKFDQRILGLDQPDKDYFEQVRVLKYEYDMSMQRIMAQHKIKTEFEVWSTFVMSHSKKSTDYKFHEEIGRISKALKDEFRGELVNLAGCDDFNRLMPYAVAAYQLTAEQVTEALQNDKSTNSPQLSTSGDGDEFEEIVPELPKVPFCSFPWLLSDILCKIASVSNFDEDQTSTIQAVKRTNRTALEASLTDGQTMEAPRTKKRDPKTYAHNASPELKRASGRSSSSSSHLDPFMALDPLKSRRNSSRTESTSSDAPIKEEAEIAGAEKVEAAVSVVPSTKEEALKIQADLHKAPLPAQVPVDETTWDLDPFTRSGPPKERPTLKVHIFKGSGKPVEAAGMSTPDPSQGQPATPQKSSPSEWAAFAEKEISRSSSKASTSSKLRADAPDFMPGAAKSNALGLLSGNVYDTGRFSRDGSPSGRPKSSDSSSFVHLSQEETSVGISPVDEISPTTAKANGGDEFHGGSKKPFVFNRPGVMGDPLLMTDEQKAALLNDDDLD